MDQGVLKYGDLVIIYGALPSAIQNPNKCVKKRKAPSQKNAGFLSGLGFTDTRVFFQKVPNMRGSPLACVSDLTNHRELVFQVWPKLNCEAHKKMRKFNKEKQVIYELSDDEKDETVEEAYSKLNLRITEESKAHHRMLGQIKGNPVIYGSEVQFMHFNSKSFLKADVSCSHSDKSAYKFELSHEHSSRMAFKIRPKYNVRQEGEPVQFGDEVLVYSAKLDCYMNFSLNSPVEIDKDVQIPLGLPSISVPFEHVKPNKGCKRYEAHISQFKDCVWKIYFYGLPKDDESTKVRGGDLIRLRHSEQNAYLAADICMRSPNPEAYGRLYDGEVEQEQDSMSTIWQVETDNLDNRCQVCEIIDDKKEPKYFRLRHLLTGKVLSYSNVAFEGQKWRIPTLMNSEEAKNISQIIFHCFANQPKKELYYNTAYGMGFKLDSNNDEECNDDESSLQEAEEEGDDEEEEDNKYTSNFRYVSMHTDKDYTQLDDLLHHRMESYANLDDNVKVFKPLKETEFVTKKKVFIVESFEPSAEHAFIIQKLSPEVEADISFVASNIPILIVFRDLIKSASKIHEIGWEVISKAKLSLKSLILFVQKIDMKTMERFDALSLEGSTHVARQKLLKDFRIIEILTEILYYPFENGIFTLQKIDDEDFRMIFQYCYRLLKHIINEYRPNEIYASQWLEHYMSQALASDNVDIKAEETLTELIDNNKKILDSKIDSKIIRRFVKILTTNQNEKFVNLLQALIVCDGEALLKNQTETSRLIFENKEVCSALIFKMRLNDDKVEVDVKDYLEDNQIQWLPVQEFYYISNERDGGEKFRYFIGLINLFANLCLERNYISIDYLQKVYTYQICFHIISGDHNDIWELKSAFAKLMHSLWIDRKPYRPLNIPRYIILWEEITSSNSYDLPSPYVNSGEFANLMEYLQNYFSDLAQQGCTKIYEVDRNKFTLVALEITSTLVKFGFYSTQEKLKELAKPLLVLLNGMVDALDREEYDKFSTKLQKKNQSSPGVRSNTKSLSLIIKLRNSGLLNLTKKPETTKYKESEENLIVMNCKDKICELVKTLMTLTNDIYVKKFLTRYKATLEKTMKDPAVPERAPLLKYLTFSAITPKSSGLSLVDTQINELKLISEGDYLDISKLAPTNFMKILFDLLKYEYKPLVCSAFELLYMLNSKQNYICNVLDQVRIVENTQKINAVKDIEEKIIKLSELAETSETWYSLGRAKNNEIDKCLRLIKSLGEYLVIQEGIDTKKELEDEIVHLEKLLDECYTDEDSKSSGGSAINHEFQEIFRHLKVYNPLISLLKFEYSDITKRRISTQLKLLTEIVRFLAKFAYREKANQELLTGDVKLFFKLMNRYPDMGFEILIEELFRNNRMLLKDSKYVDKFAKTIVKLYKADEPNYKNARLVEALQVLLTYQGKALKQNQVSVTSLLTLGQNADSFFGFLQKENLEELQKKLSIYDQKVQKQGTDEGGRVEIPPDLDAIISLIHIFGAATAGKNSVTESKAQSLFSVDLLTSLYQSSKHCWYLKYAVLVMFFGAYVDTEKGMKDEIARISDLLKMMVNDMEYLGQKKPIYTIYYHKGSVQSDIIKELVFFKGLLPCFDEIVAKKLGKGIPESRELFMKALELILVANGTTLKPQYKSKTKSCIDIFKIHARDIYDEVFSSHNMVESPLSFSMQIADNEGIQDSFTMLIKDENPRVNRLKKIIKKIVEREDFQKSVEEEFERVITAITNLEKVQEVNCFACPVSFEDVVKSLMKVIDIQENIVNKELKLQGLKIFRKIIEVENKSERTTAGDWDTEVWIRYKVKIKERQDTLCELGLVETLCNMISLSNDVDLQFESLLVSIALLVGGNANGQQAFLKYMRDDFQNNFLFTLKDLIARNFESIKKPLSEKNKSYLKRARLLLELEKTKGKKKSMYYSKTFDDNGEDKDMDDHISIPENDDEYMKEVSLSLLILKRVYKFLQLLCEGHNFDLQSHLRAQKMWSGALNRKTYDFISHTAYHFNALLNQINIDSLEVTAQVLDFLIEAVQGPCEENQKALAKANIINSCMDFMTIFKKRTDYFKRGFFSREEISQMDQVSVKSMKLLNALIEGDVQDDILQEMESLDHKFLIAKLSAYYSSFVKTKLKMNPETDQPSDIVTKMKQDSFDQTMLESFDVYILLSNLADHSDKAAYFLHQTEDYSLLSKRALEFFRCNTAHIEISFNNKLLKTYFPIYPVCHHLTSETRNNLMGSVNRASPNEKIMGLLKAAPELFDEMEHLTFLNSQVFTFSMKRYSFLRDFSTLLSLLINLMLLFTGYYGMSNEISQRKNHPLGQLSSEAAITVLGMCQICTSVLMIVFWVVINTPMIVRKKWRDLIVKKRLNEEEERRLAIILEERELGQLPLKMVLEILWRKGPYDPIFYHDGKRDFGHPFVRLMWIYKNIIFTLAKGKFIFMVFYLIVSVLGYQVSEITYCLHLLDIINRSDTLRNVVRSVTFNIKQLMLTGFLGLILIYIYSLVGFVFLDDQYYDSDIEERTCVSMLHCYITTISFGLRSGGGIGEALQKPSYQDDKLTAYYFRFVFDVTFFIIINIVFLNIIFGIIIDTFAELRDAKKFIDEDMYNKCYICNIDRYTMDKDGEGFEVHIKNDHFLWNYVFFVYSVNAKDPTEYNGIESYVKHKLDTQDISWFPLQRAMVLEQPKKKTVWEN